MSKNLLPEDILKLGEALANLGYLVEEGGDFYPGPKLKSLQNEKNQKSLIESEEDERVAIIHPRIESQTQAQAESPAVKFGNQNCKPTQATLTIFSELKNQNSSTQKISHLNNQPDKELKKDKGLKPATGVNPKGKKDAFIKKKFNQAMKIARGEDGYKKNPREAVAIYKQILQLNPNFFPAKYKLAIHNERNWGIDKKAKKGEKTNKEKAFAIYKEIADEHKIPQVQFDVGRCYLEGVGVGREPKAAIPYLKLATEGEDAWAMAAVKLAECYEKGDGVDADDSLAYHYYQLAIKLDESYQNNANIKKSLSTIKARFRQQEEDNAQALAKKKLTTEKILPKSVNSRKNTTYEPKSVDFKNINKTKIELEELKDCIEKIEFFLAGEKKEEDKEYLAELKAEDVYCKARESILAKDFKGGKKFLFQAAKLGNPKALYIVASTEDYIFRKVKFLKESARRGCVNAQYDLAQIYCKGEGEFKACPADAIPWYKAALRNNYFPAAERLAYCYENAIGCELDLDNAFVLYTVALEDDSAELFSLALTGIRSIFNKDPDILLRLSFPKPEELFQLRKNFNDVDEYLKYVRNIALQRARNREPNYFTGFSKAELNFLEDNQAFELGDEGYADESKNNENHDHSEKDFSSLEARNNKSSLFCSCRLFSKPPSPPLLSLQASVSSKSSSSSSTIPSLTFSSSQDEG